MQCFIAKVSIYTEDFTSYESVFTWKDKIKEMSSLIGVQNVKECEFKFMGKNIRLRSI